MFNQKIAQLKKDFGLAFFIAGTQLSAKKGQTFVAVASVTFGISVFVYVVGYISGVNRYIRDITLVEYPHVKLFIDPKIAKFNVIDRVLPETINFVSHVKIKNKPPNIREGIIITKQLAKDSRVNAVSSTINMQVFFHQGPNSFPGRITGIDFADEDKMFDLNSKVIEGGFGNFGTTRNSIVMGSGLSQRLSLKLGDRVVLSSPSGKTMSTTLVGIVKTGILEIDKELCYADANMVRHFLGVPASSVTEIKLKLNDKSLSKEVFAELSGKYFCNGSYWEIDNALLFEGVELQDFIFNAIAIIVMTIAGFGIYNILNIIIYEKMKDISILKAIGFSDSDIRKIFMAQALSIGILGGLCGAFLGFILSYISSNVAYDSEALASLHYLPMNFSPVLYFEAFCFATTVTAIAGYIPSKRASGTDPIIILRGQ